MADMWAHSISCRPWKLHVSNTQLSKKDEAFRWSRHVLRTEATVRGIGDRGYPPPHAGRSPVLRGPCSPSYSNTPRESTSWPQNWGPDIFVCRAVSQDGGVAWFFWHLEEAKQVPSGPRLLPVQASNTGATPRGGQRTSGPKGLRTRKLPGVKEKGAAGTGLGALTPCPHPGPTASCCPAPPRSEQAGRLPSGCRCCCCHRSFHTSHTAFGSRYCGDQDRGAVNGSGCRRRQEA